MAYPELSAEFLKRKISNLEKTEVPTLVVADIEMPLMIGVHGPGE